MKDECGMNTLEAIAKRTSVRAYKEEQIPDAKANHWLKQNGCIRQETSTCCGFILENADVV